MIDLYLVCIINWEKSYPAQKKLRSSNDEEIWLKTSFKKLEVYKTNIVVLNRSSEVLTQDT